SVAENASNATVTVTLTGATTKTATVGYATSDGTATDGTNYTGTSGTLTFSPGQTEATFTVSLLDDDVFDGDKTVSLTLSEPSNATLGDPSQVSLTLTDTDNPPSLQFSSATIAVGEGDG